MLFSQGPGALAYADEALNITADVIAALDDPQYLAARQIAGIPGPSVRYVTLQEIVNRSRLGRELTAQMQQATARNAPQDEISRLAAKLQEDFQKVLAPVVDRSARNAGLRLVIASSESGLIWGDKTLDFTGTIVHELDALPPR